MLIKMEALPKIEEKVETLLGTRLSEYCTVNIMHTDFGATFTVCFRQMKQMIERSFMFNTENWKELQIRMTIYPCD